MIINKQQQKTSFKPLFYDKNDLICSKNNKVFKVNSNGSKKHLFTIPVGKLTKALFLFRFFIRIFRLDIYSSYMYENKYFVCFLGKLYSFDIQTEKLRVEMSFIKGHGPLSFTSTHDIEGFDNSLYFGDYFSDTNFDRIQIHMLNETGDWSSCYTFQEGLINHIHALVPDPLNKCIWILTGDYGSSYGIYKASKNFTKVEPVLVGNQKYRSCVAYPFENGLLYATDSHLENNSIRLLYCKNDKWFSKAIANINGPVIYGCELLDYYIFATSVEPGKPKKNWLSTLLDRGIGPGIIKNQVEIIAIKKGTQNIMKVYEDPKDYLPARLFQFGSAMFPSSSSHTNQLAAYFTATLNNDGKTMFIDISQIDSKNVS